MQKCGSHVMMQAEHVIPQTNPGSGYMTCKNVEVML